MYNFEDNDKIIECSFTKGGGGGGSNPTFIVSLAWTCDETNFKLLLRKKVFKKKVKISVRFQGKKINSQK